MTSISDGETGASVRTKLNTLFTTYETIAALAASTSLVDGKYYTVSVGPLGTPDTLKYDADSTATADGALIVDATGMGAGRLVSTRRAFNSDAEFQADNRSDSWFTTGDIASIGGPSGYTLEKVTSGENRTSDGGSKWLVSGGNPLALGASGDGSTNDKTPLDTLNISGTTVNLQGKTYAYTGDFVPSAYFDGGVIIATNGTFDFRVPIIFKTHNTSIGAAGVFKSWPAFVSWFSSREIYAAVNVEILEHDVVVLPTTISNTNSHLLKLYCSTAPTSGVPTHLDYTEVGGGIADAAAAKAADVTAQQINYAGSLYFPTVGAVVGIAAPNGISIEDLLVISDTDYTIDVGFNGAHQHSTAGGVIYLSGTCHIGGKWGVITTGKVRQRGSVSFAHQTSGGPADLIGGAEWRAINAAHKIYAFTPTEDPKYVFNVENSLLDVSNVLNVKGPFFHCVKATGQANAIVRAANIDGPPQIMSLLDGAVGTCYGNTVTLGDIDDFVAFGSDQTANIGNITKGAVLFAGKGSVIDTGANTFTGGNVAYFAFIGGGKLVASALDTWDGTYCKTNAYQYSGADNGFINGNFINKPAGTQDDAWCYTSGLQRTITGHTGITYATGLATDTAKGSGFTSALY